MTRASADKYQRLDAAQIFKQPSSFSRHHMKPLTCLFLCLSIFATSGCQNPSIVRVSSDTYLLIREDHAGVFGSMSKLKAGVIGDANTFAESLGKVAVPVSARETPVGSGFAQWASYEYQFRIVDRNSPEAKSTNFPTEVIAFHPPAQTPVEQAQTQAALDRFREQLQRDQASVNAAYSQAADNMRRVNDQSLADFNSQVKSEQERRAAEEREKKARSAAALQSLQSPVYSSQTSTTPPQMPSGLGGIPTGRTNLGLDGTTYYEMRDVNGTTYWTNKR